LAIAKLLVPFWYRRTQVVPDKGPLNGCIVAKVITIIHYLAVGQYVNVCKLLANGAELFKGKHIFVD